MRDFSSLDSSRFCDELARISITASTEWNKLTTAVMDNSNFPKVYDFRFSLPSDLNSNIALAIASWYIPGNLGVMIREEIREKYSSHLEDSIVLSLILDSRFETEIFLLDTSLYHTRDFFGNIYNAKKLKQILSQVRWLVKPRARKLLRKRGYHDKGSMNLFPQTAYVDKKFIDLTREHYELEAKRNSHQDTIAYLKGWYFSPHT